MKTFKEFYLQNQLLRAGFIPLIICFLSVACFTSCTKVDVVKAGTDSMSLQKFHDNLKNRLDGNCVGYAFIISYNGFIQLPYSDAGGKKRTAANPPEAKFGLMDPINIASVSKEITAVAVIKAMGEKNVQLSDKISSYLPGSWTQGPNIDQITFKQLLVHTSGFRKVNGVDYTNLKKLIADGVTLSDISKEEYHNEDFALFRYIVPAVLGKTQLTDQQYSSEFLQYCQKVIFDPIQIWDVQVKSAGGNTQALSYPFPAGNASGTDWGDNTLSFGSQGFNLSAWQLAVFQNNLWHTTKILSQTQQNTMRTNKLGLYNSGNVHNTPYWGHNGFFPYVPQWNQGLLWAQLMHFDNGVDVAVLVNSPIAENGATPTTNVYGVTGTYLETVITQAYNASF